MTEKYDGRGINVNGTSEKFFSIIGKLEKEVSRRGKNGEGGGGGASKHFIKRTTLSSSFSFD